MAKYKVLSEESQFDTHQYMVDEVADVSSLPKDEPGSVVIVAATSDVYILNNKKQWIKL